MKWNEKCLSIQSQEYEIQSHATKGTPRSPLVYSCAFAEQGCYSKAEAWRAKGLFH